ncbi:MAG: type secretion system protein VirB11-like, partial [Spirosoma sp.]|nr:type secretion system protein VirB11-like [Spirosoma sp.]
KSAAGVFDAMLLMAKQHPTARSLDTADLRQTLRELIDFVAFSEVVNGKRRVTQIWFDPEAKKGPAGNTALQALKDAAP